MKKFDVKSVKNLLKGDVVWVHFINQGSYTAMKCFGEVRQLVSENPDCQFNDMGHLQKIKFINSYDEIETQQFFSEMPVFVEVKTVYR